MTENIRKDDNDAFEDSFQVSSSGTISFVVCTKDRPFQLERCLSAITPQLARNDELLVIDNSLQGTAKGVSEEFGARWIPERRPGVGWARNRGYKEASGKIIAYIDDDCTPDLAWAKELQSPFDDPKVGIVTGGVLNSRLDLAIPYLVHSDYSYHRGWSPIRFEGSTGTPWSPFDIWRVGVGCNMAWRKSALECIGGFDPALGAGTPAGSTEDIDAFRRALTVGVTIYYQPTALVWHDVPHHLCELRALLVRYALALGAHAAKAAFEDHQWRALAFLSRDWYLQIKKVLNILFSRKSENLHLPISGLLAQPPASILGMVRFLKYRRMLREGQWHPMSKRNRQIENRERSSAPSRSGIMVEEIDIKAGYTDRQVVQDTLLLIRENDRPIAIVEMCAGERITETLHDNPSVSTVP